MTLPVAEVDPTPLAVGCHPAVDELDERYVAYATSSPTVRYTEPFATFLAEAEARRVRPVLVTATTARVSPFVSSAMGRAGGVWAVQTRDWALFDAMSGYRIGPFSELWADPRPTGRERLPGFEAPSAAPVRVVTFDVHTHRRAEAAKVGVVADLLGDRLGTRWECWATREPLLEAWDVAAVTRAAQRWMPRSHTCRVVGTGGAYAQVQVDRTRTGLLEHTTGGVPVDEGADVLALAEGVAEGLVGTHNPTVAFVSVAQYERDADTGAVVQTVRQRPAEAPVALLVGARAVRDLGVDLGTLAGDLDVRVMGRAKVPCLLVRFDGSRSEERWSQMARFAEVLGPEAIQAALGVV